MTSIIPPKLKRGDTLRIIAPAMSLSIITPETRAIAQKRFDELGLHLSFGKHTEECDDFTSSSIASRIDDLHNAFTDENVHGILTVIGGHNTNQLLRFIDWQLIASHPKVFCGFSDITALSNAMLAKANLVSYSGPHYSTFGQKLHFEYTLEYFQKCLMQNEPFEVLSSPNWSDDEWYLNQDERHLISNDGFVILQDGDAKGQIVGGNLCTLNLLQGTEYMPDLRDTILFLEDDFLTFPANFDRDLQSLIHLPQFSLVRGLVIGRFQKKSHVTLQLLQKIIETKKELKNLLVIANVDFGHTDPKITFPIGGTVHISAYNNTVSMKIVKH